MLIISRIRVEAKTENEMSELRRFGVYKSIFPMKRSIKFKVRRN